MSLRWMRGATADMHEATIKGGPYPDNVDVIITGLFGDQGWRFHRGMDSAPYNPFDWSTPVAYGTPLVALGYGYVAAAGFDPVVPERVSGAGNFVVCMYEDGEGGFYNVQYFHMAELAHVAVGDKVTPGLQVGRVGSTGNSTGPHLHLECYHNGYLVDPLAMLDAAEPLGYVPPAPGTPPPTGPVYTYPVPDFLPVAYKGKTPDHEWLNEFEARVKTVRAGDLIELSREGRDGDYEVLKITVQDWAET